MSNLVRQRSKANASSCPAYPVFIDFFWGEFRQTIVLYDEVVNTFFQTKFFRNSLSLENPIEVLCLAHGFSKGTIQPLLESIRIDIKRYAVVFGVEVIEIRKLRLCIVPHEIGQPCHRGMGYLRDQFTRTHLKIFACDD